MYAANRAVIAPMTATTVMAVAGLREEHMTTRDHVYAGGYHGSRVDQRADRRGAFHGIRKPDVKGYLGGLAHGPDEQQQGYRRNDRREDGRIRRETRQRKSAIRRTGKSGAGRE